MCQTLNLQIIICFVCLNRSCSDGAVSIFHARWGILTMSGLRSSFTRKWMVTGMPNSMLKSNQNITSNKTPPELLLVGQYPLFRTTRGMCLLVEGEYKLTI